MVGLKRLCLKVVDRYNLPAFFLACFVFFTPYQRKKVKFYTLLGGPQISSRFAVISERKKDLKFEKTPNSRIYLRGSSTKKKQGVLVEAKTFRWLPINFRSSGYENVTEQQSSATLSLFYNLANLLPVKNPYLTLCHGRRNSQMLYLFDFMCFPNQ